MAFHFLDVRPLFLLLYCICLGCGLGFCCYKGFRVLRRRLSPSPTLVATVHLLGTGRLPLSVRFTFARALLDLWVSECLDAWTRRLVLIGVAHFPVWLLRFLSFAWAPPPWPPELILSPRARQRHRLARTPRCAPPWWWWCLWVLLSVSRHDAFGGFTLAWVPSAPNAAPVRLLPDWHSWRILFPPFLSPSPLPLPSAAPASTSSGICPLQSYHRARPVPVPLLLIIRLPSRSTRRSRLGVRTMALTRPRIIASIRPPSTLWIVSPVTWLAAGLPRLSFQFVTRLLLLRPRVPTPR
jgi:hypothetical protein